MGAWLKELWVNPTFATRVFRSIIGGVGAGGAAFSSDITPLVPTGWASAIKITCSLMVLISFMVPAGDKTPDNVKQLADNLNPLSK